MCFIKERVIMNAIDYTVFDSMYYDPIVYENITYPSVENAFQASRFKDISMKYKFVKMTPYEAAYRGKAFKTTVSDWDYMKNDIMYDLLKIKFSKPDLKHMLLSTSDDIIITCNNHDRHWRVCTCQQCKNTGSNVLGNLLTQLRSELSQNENIKYQHEII